MKTKFIARAASIAAVVVLHPAILAGGEPPNDPVSLRTLEFVREHGHYMDGVRFPKDHPYWKELQWYRDQGEAVRPALMYLLTDEYRGHYRKMADEVLALEHAPGDQTELLDFVRAELAKRPEPRPEGYCTFLSAAMSALSKHGNRDDLTLIQEFQSDEDVRLRVSANIHGQNLEMRLAEQSKEPERQRRDAEGRDNVEGPRGDTLPAEHLGTSADGGDRAGMKWAIFGAGGLLVVAFAVYCALRRRG
jgi:hypothetical protein